MEEKIAIRCKTKDEWDRARKKSGSKVPLSFEDVMGFTSGVVPVLGTNSPHSWNRDDGYFEKLSYTIISAADYLKEGEVEEFKPGDSVKFVKGGLCGIEETEWWKSERLILGNTYEIYEISDKGNPKVAKGGLWHHKDHFELTNKQNKPKSKENKMNTSIEKVFADDKVREGNLVQKYFGAEIAEDFTGELILEQHKQAYLAEAKSREKIAKAADK